MHERYLTMLEVPETTVDQATRPARRSGRDVGLVEEEDLEATQRGVTSDAGAIDATSNHDDIERSIPDFHRCHPEFLSSTDMRACAVCRAH